MAVNEVRLCMGCMSPLFEDGKCSTCGYDLDGAEADLNFLSPGSSLSDRYLVGRLTTQDTEGAWYVGYDRQEEMRVWIREYAPATITRRSHEDGSVQPLSSAQAQYKALLSDFEDLCSSIRRLSPSEKVIPILDVVHANNTVYGVYRYLKTISLASFLERSGGKLSWRHAKKLLMPLFHTVANVHKAGLIHRGLSPYTIQLDQTGALWIWGFTIAAARTHKSELSAQLFEGYAAPEQYSLNSWQGTWTDVYALGAITYRTVTGEQPPAAMDRIYGDDLLDSQITNAEMTENIVTAINRALAVEVEDRIQTAEAYVAELLATGSSDTAVYTAPVVRKSYETQEDSDHRQEIRQAAAVRAQQDVVQTVPQKSRFEDYDKGIDVMPVPVEKKTPSSNASGKQRPAVRRRKKKKTRPVLALFLSALVATALLGYAVYWVTNNFLADLITPAESGSHSGVENAAGVEFEDKDIEDNNVPKFVGITAQSIRDNTKLNERFQITFKEGFNNDYEPGVVFEQQPVEGTPNPAFSQITLFVSKGPEKVEMPQVVDLTIEEATALLNGLQIKFDVIPVFNNTYKPGVVVRTDRDAGVMLDKNRDVVILYIKKEDEASKGEEEDPGDRVSRSSSSNRTSSSASSKSSVKVTSKKGPTVSYDDSGNKVIIFDDED